MNSKTVTPEHDVGIDSIDTDIKVAQPEIVLVEVSKEPEINEDDQADISNPNIDEPDDLTAAYDGNFELAAKETSEAAARVEPDEPKDHIPELNLYVLKDNPVKDYSKSAAESQLESNPNPEVLKLSEEDNDKEGVNTISVADIVSSREFSLESKEVLDQEPSGESALVVDGSESEEETKQMISGDNTSDRISGQISEDDESGNLEALAALLKAVTGGGGGSSGLSAATLRANPSNIFSNPNVTMSDESEINLSEEEKQKLEKLQSLRVKYLRLLQRLGYSAEDSKAAQVLYRLAQLAGRKTGQLFSLDAAKKMAMEFEQGPQNYRVGPESKVEGNKDLNFSINILVLGKAGVGKSSTINSILGNQKSSSTDAFELSTTSVREISETVDGVKITFIDTPGLKVSAMDQITNTKMLSSVKKVMKKCPPDIVLYVDRLDTQVRVLNDLPLLKTITTSLGSSIWKNCTVTLTHAASAPPDGPFGTPLSYDVFEAQCSYIIQNSIGQALAGNLHFINRGHMIPVSLVENHPLCRKNRDGAKILPNGQTWRSHLLLLCYSKKVLSEANSLVKNQELDYRQLFGFGARFLNLSNLLSTLLSSRGHPKLSTDQSGDEIDDLSDYEDGEDDEYDELPPFKPLRKAQLEKLSKEQKKAYFEEYDYRVKLLQKKQLREALKMMKTTKNNIQNMGPPGYREGEEEEEEEVNDPRNAVQLPLPENALPNSFDSDNSTYRYRFLEPTSQLLIHPLVNKNGWDHDYGYDGVYAQQNLAIANRFPAINFVRVTKDKKKFNIHCNSSVSAKHGDNGSTTAELNIQSQGKQLVYEVRGETKFKSLKKNKTTLGGSMTLFDENVAFGVKLEDQVTVGKRFVFVGSTGGMRSKGDSAYGGTLEVRLREADFPIGQDQAVLGLSLVKWRDDLELGANFSSLVSVGRNSEIAVRAELNNEMKGGITVRTKSSDQLQIALVVIYSTVVSIYERLRPK